MSARQTPDETAATPLEETPGSPTECMAPAPTALLTRFHVVFFAAFLALGVLLLLGGEIAEPSRAPAGDAIATLEDIPALDPVELAEKLVEGRKGFVVADWMATSFVPGSIRIAEGDDAVARLVEATGGDTRLTVVLLSHDDETALATAAALEQRGYRVQRVHGGSEAWQRDILDVYDTDDDHSSDATVRALSGFLQGKTGPSSAPAPPPPTPVAVPVRPRPRNTSGDGGC